MKTMNNLLIVTAGILIVLTGYVMEKVEAALEDSFLGYVVDGLMIAAMFFMVMRLLQWAVWVM